VLLLLFDVDGTLLLSDDPLLGRAAADAVREAFGVEIAPDALSRLDHAGRTALRQGRELLRHAGLPEREIDAGLGRWCGLLADRYLELLAGADTSHWRAAPRAHDALERLAAAGHRLALLTGNPEPMARERMKRLGLDGFFEPGQGAFGCDAEARTELIELARARAGGWPADTTVAVGDTERDTRSAAAAGIRSIRVGAAGLAGAVAQLLAYT
jgi:phosphoglycolate phosphatase